MRRPSWRRFVPLLLGLPLPCALYAQRSLSWDEVRERFQKNNPSLLAGQLLIDESQADEITAGLRPNPMFSSINDEFLFFNPDKFKPFGTSQWTQSVSQLIERQRKRPLRVESARLATRIAGTDQQDLVRQMLFDLRDAFVRTLQAKSLLDVARENLDYYDKILDVNRARLKSGDIAQVDLTRLDLQRAQFQSDLVNAVVNLRTAKISLLSLMNERQSVDSLDVDGEFAFRALNMTIEEARQGALDARPDLRSAATAITKVKADNKLAWANGSTDPEMYFEYQRAGSDNTMGFGVNFPLRIFDRNQGEKARTAVEIKRAERNREAVVSGILRDVDSAFATMESVRDLILPYRDRYIPAAHEVRETVSFSYAHGGASLLDFLDAQKSYRDTELAYQNLIGNYLSALNQLSQAVGKEITP
jgi:cobalt-zinc-cadmium efflux system outer membrane protein